MHTIVDLHTHTNQSDGTNSPTQLIQLAKQIGLAGVAITDHDTIGGWEEAFAAGKKHNVLVVPGVEISSIWGDKDIHVLGYYVTPDDTFLSELDQLRNARNRRNVHMVDKLQQLGISITMEEVAARKVDQKTNIGRPHIAEVLMEKGIVTNMREAFDLYLGRDGKAYVNVPRISPHEAVRLIKAAKGVAVLAHPGLYNEDAIIDSLVQEGLDGIEAFHADHTLEMEEHYKKIGERYRLLITGGSDYHGVRNNEVFHEPLGSKGVTLSTVAQLEERARSLG